ncbi:glycoside hydrolase family 28 protein [Hymenopellis radicata]|nr:glycoside hydrolase family 28 protein [Hymenopellis radicata]
MLWFPLLLTASAAWAQCTLEASGKDDASQLIAAARSCRTVNIPSDTTLNISTRLDMTGLSDVTINLEGTIRFNPDIPYWVENAFPFEFQAQVTFWLLGGENIVLKGGGTLDGAGQPWYDAFAANSSLPRPIILTIYQGNHVLVENIEMIDSPEWFNLIYESNDVRYSNMTITAATNTHNTDGWNIYRSDTVTLEHSVIVNGDDCVAFKPNATNILVSDLDCTGSHGISVGSLGQYPEFFDIVENVTATDIKMSNAQNGARIKAWAGPDVGSGIVRNVTFNNFVVSSVANPVVIDQCYMTSAADCSAFPSNTFIQDIWFNGISGTSSGSTVASLLCSPDGRCSNINVNDLELTAGKGTTTYKCQNVNLTGNAAGLFPDCTVT